MPESSSPPFDLLLLSWTHHHFPLLVNRFLPESTTTGAPISHPKCRSNWQTRLMKMTYFGDKRRARKNWWGHKILLTYIAVTTAMVGLGPRSWIGGLFNRSGNKRSGSAKFLVRPLTLLQASFLRLLFKKGGKRAEWEYPFAVAGINVSFMLIQMLDLYAAKPKCLSGMNFLRLLGENEEAFDILYCVAFAMMDAQWLAMKASYMEFNDVLKVTRTQLERELSLEDIRRIQDLPAYNLLFH